MLQINWIGTGTVSKSNLYQIILIRSSKISWGLFEVPKISFDRRTWCYYFRFSKMVLLSLQKWYIFNVNEIFYLLRHDLIWWNFGNLEVQKKWKIRHLFLKLKKLSSSLFNLNLPCLETCIRYHKTAICTLANYSD